MHTSSTTPVAAPPRMAAPGWLAAVCGLLAAGAAIAGGGLVAALVPAWPSPVVAVADRVIDAAAPRVTSWAIDTLGTADKPVLVAGLVVILAVLAGGLGLLARTRPWLAVGGVGTLGLIGAAAGAADPAAGATGALPGIAAAAAGALALLALRAGLVAVASPAGPEATGQPGGGDRADVPDPGRRRLLWVAATVVAGTAAMGVAGRVLVGRFDIDAARAALALPVATERVDLPAPSAAHLDVDGVSPLFTPNADFYRIDTALSIPRIDPDFHVVRVTGMVDTPLEVAFRDLLTRDLIEVPITIACVSNEVGGDLVGNAAWLGVRLRDLLDEAGVAPDADQIVGRSVDGYTGGFPVAAAYDRDTLLAVGMNGEPLPARHGFPVRLVTPGLYGYVSATKWLAEIELTRFDRFEQYWVPRGYAERAPIKTQARIDVPAGRAEVAAGVVHVAGVAWAPTLGIDAVEVQVDDGDWQAADLADPVAATTWRLWRYAWDATPGAHRIRVRATDGDGQTQTEERAPTRPDGATGRHTIQVTVTG